MSGDVQPRKRKDKKRKKEGGSLGMISDPITLQKLKRTESDDWKSFDLPEQGEKIHVQNEKGIGGNICVKIVFFCLFGLLIFAVGLIYLQSQGSTDVDLPTIEESRFADYFTGWLDNNHNDEQEHEHELEHNDLEHDQDDDHEEEEGEDQENGEDEDHSPEEVDQFPSLFGIQSNNEIDESNENDVEEIDDKPGKTSEWKDMENERDGKKEKEEEDDDDDDDNDNDDDNENDGDDVDDDDDNAEDLVSEDKDSGINDEENDEDEYDASQMDEDEVEDSTIYKYNKIDFSKIRKNKASTNYKYNKLDFSKIRKNKAKVKEDEDDQDSDEENVDKTISEEEEADSENMEEEQSTYTESKDNHLGSDGIEISDEDLDDLDLKKITPSEKDSSFESPRDKIDFKKAEFEIDKENTEEEDKVGGVAVKLGVGILLIIVAHLVLVQKWKAMGNSSCDEKTSDEVDVIEKKEMQMLNQDIEPVLFRRQTLIPKNVCLNDDMENENEEEDDIDNEEEEEEEVEEEQEVDQDDFDNDDYIAEDKSNYNIEKEMFSKKLVENESVCEKTNLNWKSAENHFKEKEKSNKKDDENIIEDDVEDEDENEDEDFEEEVEDEEDIEEVEDEREDFEEDVEEEDEDYEEEIEDEEEDEDDDEEEEDDEKVLKSQKPRSRITEELSGREESSTAPPLPPPRANRNERGPQNIEDFMNVDEVEENDDGPKGIKESQSHATETKDPESGERKVGNEDEWTFRQELDFADEHFENNPRAAVNAYDKILSKKPEMVRALIGRARALDHLAELEKSNTYLKQAINAYKSLLLNQGHLLQDDIYLKLAERCIERMRFGGALTSAIDIHKALIMKNPNIPKYRNMLAVTYLMLNKISLARRLLNETLSLWPKDGFALVHYGFILKTSDNNMEEGAKMLMAGIQTKEEGVIDGMFFFHLGDALNRLGRGKEAMEWYDLGVKEGLFLSRYQRSLYNVNRLKGQPWWTKEETTYQDFFKKLEDNWAEIKKEGLSLLHSKGINLFKEETENLKDTGDWRQLDLFFRGRKQANCNKAPITCALVSSFKPASSCTRGQIKFSVMLPETHVWPHCGPTNCRLRSHLGLVVPKKTYIRVAEETRSWEEGKFIIFDDSFEHEVWHNGTGLRLVLIVDVWHPELTNQERQYLSPI